MAEGSDAAITSFDDLPKHWKAATFDGHGQQRRAGGPVHPEDLYLLRLDEASLASAGVLTYGSNVKEVTTQITEGSVDCGVVYCTDAYSAGITPWTTPPKRCAAR